MPDLEDAPVPEHEDEVEGPDAVEAMTERDDRERQAAQHLADAGIRLRIDVRRWLVAQERDRRLGGRQGSG